jgi:hypothetical protein
MRGTASLIKIGALFCIIISTAVFDSESASRKTAGLEISDALLVP